MVFNKSRIASGFAMASIAALAFAGCGNAGTTETVVETEVDTEVVTTHEPEATVAEETEATATAAPAVEGEPVTITYMHRLPDGAEMVLVQDIVDRWNAEHPNIQVEPTKFAGASSEMITRLETDINNGVGPCLAQIGYSEAPDVFVRGLLQDVTDIADQYKGNFSEGAFNSMNVGGVQVGLPQDVGPLVYYYNADEFAALGIELPTNIEEFEAAAKVAKEHGKYLVALTPDEAQFTLSSMAAAAGDVWFDTANDEWVVDTTGPGTQRVAAFWQNLLDNDEVLVLQRWGDDFTQALTSGELIGHIGAAWEAGFLLDPLDGTPYEGQWRVAQLPDFGAGQITGPNGGSGVAVMTGCEHPAEAMEFNNWFNTQIDDLATQGLVVAANGSPATPEKMDRQFGGQDVLGELATATSHLNPNFKFAPGFATLTDMIQSTDAAANGQTPFMAVFEGAQTTMTDALRNLGLPVASN